MRKVVIFAGLAAFAGLAIASSRRVAPGGGGDAITPPAEDAAGDWGELPDFAGDATAYLEDAMGGVIGERQSMSWEGLQRLANMEGFSAVPYSDFKGYSIGHGHLIQPGESLSYVTRDDAMALLSKDVADAERTVRTAVKVALSQNQFDALVSFTYNVGAGAFRRSTLLRRLNAGDYAGAAGEFSRWNMAGGKPLAALDQRRATEKALFEA